VNATGRLIASFPDAGINPHGEIGIYVFENRTDLSRMGDRVLGTTRYLDEGHRVDGPVGPVPRDEGGPPPVTGNRTPTDPDGDGVYEDVTGDGAVTVLDVAVFLDALDAVAAGPAAAAFDVDGNGRVTVLDVVRLLTAV
jgi:PKD repeat protein